MREAEWQSRARAHADRVGPWVRERVERQSVRRPHAVWDFLFDYYPYSPAKLATWHPGVGVVLEGEPARRYLDVTGYRECVGGVTIEPALRDGQRRRLDFAIAVLEGTTSRPAATGCFALHEWAMTYGLEQDEVRHAYLPLRLPPAEITRTVDAVGLRCTHVDAYRFFTPEALPRNEFTPSRATQADDDQPGCLHAAMDLYKYASWFAPLVGSDLVADCFEHAARSRELDMRASPYDVAGFGLEAIRVETPEGRREYAEHQRVLVASTDPLRARLLATLRELRLLPDASFTPV